MFWGNNHRSKAISDYFSMFTEMHWLTSLGVRSCSLWNQGKVSPTQIQMTFPNPLSWYHIIGPHEIQDLLFVLKMVTKKLNYCLNIGWDFVS